MSLLAMRQQTTGRLVHHRQCVGVAGYLHSGGMLGIDGKKICLTGSVGANNDFDKVYLRFMMLTSDRKADASLYRRQSPLNGLLK